MSYEAKRLGVTRGMPIWEIRKKCPEAIIVYSHYDLYKIFSIRMYEIVRRYTPIVEEYSIDECFADITESSETHHLTHKEIGLRIKSDLERELGITFSVGIGPNKIIAKIASKKNKPSGFTFIRSSEIDQFLKDVLIEKVWGIGWQTALKLHKQGVRTALEFKYKPEVWIKEHCAKPYQEIWHELWGHSVSHVNTVHRDQKSIQCTRTFKPISSSRQFIFTQLSKNLEHACARARSHGLAFKHFSFFIKTQQFTYRRAELILPTHSSTPTEVIEHMEQLLGTLIIPGMEYRATGVTLGALEPQEKVQDDLFNQSTQRKGREVLYQCIDTLSKKYKKNVVQLASSLIMHQTQSKKESYAESHSFKKLNLPLMGTVS